MSGLAGERTGVILIDHGSRRSESNDLLIKAVETFRQASKWSIVAPAHMELAEPSLADAFERCVQQGAQRIVVFPYFLSPGRHWREDIPRLASQAARNHSGVSYLVTAPFGLHPLLLQLVEHRIERCIQYVEGRADECDFCNGHDSCKLRDATNL